MVPTFATFSPGLLNNAPDTILPVFGPPRIGALRVWSPSKVGTHREATVTLQLVERTHFGGINPGILHLDP